MARSRCRPPRRTASSIEWPELAEAPDGVELDHRLVVRHADHHHEADQRHRVEALSREPEQDEPAGRGQRHRQHDQQRDRERRELAGEHQEDERRREHSRPGSAPAWCGAARRRRRRSARRRPPARSSRPSSRCTSLVALAVPPRSTTASTTLTGRWLMRTTSTGARISRTDTSCPTGTPSIGVASAVARSSLALPAKRTVIGRAAVGLPELARGHAAQPAGQRVGHALDRESVLRDPLPLQGHFDGRLGGAEGVAHIGQRGYRLEPRAHRIGPAHAPRRGAARTPPPAPAGPRGRSGCRTPTGRPGRCARAPCARSGTAARSCSAKRPASAPSGTGMISCAVALVPGSAPASTSSSVALPTRA